MLTSNLINQSDKFILNLNESAINPSELFNLLKRIKGNPNHELLKEIVIMKNGQIVNVQSTSGLKSHVKLD